MLGSIFSAIGSVVGGARARAAGRARQASLNRDALERKREGEAQARAIGRDAAMAEGAGVVSAGSSGLTIDGSALDVLAWQAQQFDASARNARRNAELDAMRMRNEGRMARHQGNTAFITGIIRAGATLADGAAQTGEKVVKAAAGGGGG